MTRKNNRNGEASVSEYMTARMATMDSKESVRDIARRMVERNISSVAITDSRDRIVGILTERDIVKIVANGVPADGITTGSLMSRPVESIEKGASIEEAARAMAQKNVRHLLVEDSDSRQVIGIVTVTDLARYLKQKLADRDALEPEMWELFL